MSGAHTPQSGDDGWICPWCRLVAGPHAGWRGICESRACSCGAVAIAAPPRDTDEVVDDAIDLFGIDDAYLTPFDADRVEGLKQRGVEIAEGQSIPAGVVNRFERRVLWFRKPGYRGASRVP